MIFNEEEDEDTLVEEVPQIESGTVLHRDTRHRAIHQRNICDKWLPREACFDLGDVKVENVIVAFREDEEEDIPWRKDLKLNAARFFSGAHATVRFPKETFVTSSCRVKRVFAWAVSDWVVVVDEDILVEEGP